MKPIAQLSLAGLRRRRQHLLTMPITAKRVQQLREIDQRMAALQGPRP